MERSVQERLAVIEEVLLRMEQRLFGNGQPGELALLKERLRRVETWFWRLVGAGSVLLALLQLFNISHLFSLRP